MRCPTERHAINLFVDGTNNKPALKVLEKNAHSSGRSSLDNVENQRVAPGLIAPVSINSPTAMYVDAPPPPPANGLFRIGGGVSAPVPLVSPEAEFSEQARRAKYQGVCLVSVIVDAEGNPQNPRVIRGLGMGLDEKALEAVRRYKFKPALKDGTIPVPVMITIEVNFRLY
jgi:TonB family protein